MHEHKKRKNKITHHKMRKIKTENAKNAQISSYL